VLFKFSKKLGHVTTDMMFHQNLSQRGPERLSGMCGRLKCCLSFEEDAYCKILEELPSIGSKVKTNKVWVKLLAIVFYKKIVIIKTKDEFLELPLDEIKV